MESSRIIHHNHPELRCDFCEKQYNFYVKCVNPQCNKKYCPSCVIDFVSNLRKCTCRKRPFAFLEAGVQGAEEKDLEKLSHKKTTLDELTQFEFSLRKQITDQQQKLKPRVLLSPKTIQSKEGFDQYHQQNPYTNNYQYQNHNQNLYDNQQIWNQQDQY
ncbi:hypothetical protein M0811_08793 [Anaeramoeba ignava]|uniref:Uncharacterized protein n=1 Tax=Anaeramoeba ignava TaxID=1746090 RepID=A0A9Q0LLK8_ANAIG|nr:hypothetical protein M0811_08793 [Anaeramoeba ignava]